MVNRLDDGGFHPRGCCILPLAQITQDRAPNPTVGVTAVQTFIDFWDLLPPLPDPEKKPFCCSYVMWSVFSFLSANVELLTWPVSVSCNSSTRSHVILLREDEGMKGRRTQRCHLPIFTRHCRDWQPASEVLSFTLILSQNGAPAVTWPCCGLKTELFKGKHIFLK